MPAASSCAKRFTPLAMMMFISAINWLRPSSFIVSGWVDLDWCNGHAKSLTNACADASWRVVRCKWRHRRRGLKSRERAGSYHFPMAGCKFPTEEIMIAQNLNFPPNSPKLGISSPKFCIFWKTIFRHAKI